MTDEVFTSAHSQPAVVEKTVEPSVRSELSGIQDEADDQRGNKPVTTGGGNGHLTGVKLYTLFLALLLAVLTMALDASIMATAIPRITDDFHTVANIGWYGSAYTIANACLQPLTGKIYTFFPLKASFLVFVTLFEVGSILSATSRSSMMLIIGRAVAGLGGAGLASGSLILIGVAAPPSQRPMIVSIIMSMFGFGQLIGPLIGGALTQHVSWRWCFWINLPIGVASAAGILPVRLPPQHDKPKFNRRNFFKNFDIVGFVLFAPASIMLLIAVQWAGIEYAWSSSTIIGLLCGSGVTYIVFIFWERYQGDHAMFPSSLLCKPAVSVSMGFAFLFGGAILALAYYLPLWFQVVKHASPTDSAVYTLPTFVPQVLFAILSGPVCKVIGFFTPLAVLGAALAAVGTGLMTTFNTSTGTGIWMGYQVLSGIGRGLAFQQPFNAAQAALSDAQLSTGMAIVIWSEFFGCAVLLALAQTAFSSLLKSALKTFAPDVDPATVIHAGATNYQNVIPVQDQGKVLLAYNQAIVRTFYVAAIVTAVSAIVAVGMGWKRVIGKQSDGEKKVDSEAGHKIRSVSDQTLVAVGMAATSNK